MDFQTSSTQQKRVEKINRLREYFKADRPEIYEWQTTDERINFATMSDSQIEEYLKGHD